MSRERGHNSLNAAFAVFDHSETLPPLSAWLNLGRELHLARLDSFIELTIPSQPMAANHARCALYTAARCHEEGFDAETRTRLNDQGISKPSAISTTPPEGDGMEKRIRCLSRKAAMKTPVAAAIFATFQNEPPPIVANLAQSTKKCRNCRVNSIIFALPPKAWPRAARYRRQRILREIKAGRGHTRRPPRSETYSICLKRFRGKMGECVARPSGARDSWVVT
jgi:hypothetical protein